MTERLLQFIWQFQYFNKKELTTEKEEPLQIISPGQLNTNQGPDFLHATVIIGEAKWIGNIELRLKSSDWNSHRHSSDPNYSNIILHVVWQHDEEIKDLHGATLNTLCLQNLVPKSLLQRYRLMMEEQDFVPSQQHLPALPELSWMAWKERFAIERLQRKSQMVMDYFKAANNHWEEVFWWMLARNFGMKVNADIFENVAKSIPVNILTRHKNQIHQLEGLLFGQAGLLDEQFKEDYPQLLQREYRFYQKKYALKPSTAKPYFLRMRPANFPTIRLAQLAMLVNQSTHLFSKIKETQSLAAVKDLLNVTANDYWHYHYLFDEPGAFKPKSVGTQMTDNIIINTIVPVLFAYGSYSSEERFKDKALQWLSEIPPEKNSITSKWQEYGVSNKNALDSQALIELKNNYCNEKRCLECAVGNVILKRSIE